MQKQGTETAPTKHLKDENNTKKALTKLSPAAKNTPKRKSPAAQYEEHAKISPSAKQMGEKNPAYGELGPAHSFSKAACGEKRCGTGKSVVRQSPPCLRHVVQKTGFTTKTCASATLHHLFSTLRPDTYQVCTSTCTSIIAAVGTTNDAVGPCWNNK